MANVNGPHFDYLAHLTETTSTTTGQPRIDVNEYQATEPGLPKGWPRKGQERTPDCSRKCPQCGMTQANIPVNQVWITCNRDNCRHWYRVDVPWPSFGGEDL